MWKMWSSKQHCCLWLDIHFGFKNKQRSQLMVALARGEFSDLRFRMIHVVTRYNRGWQSNFCTITARRQRRWEQLGCRKDCLKLDSMEVKMLSTCDSGL